MRLRQLAAREVAGEGLQTFPRFRLENIDPHDLILSAARNANGSAFLEVGAHQIVRAFMAARINFGCRRANKVPIRIESAQPPCLVRLHVKLEAPKRIIYY